MTIVIPRSDHKDGYFQFTYTPPEGPPRPLNEMLGCILCEKGVCTEIGVQERDVPKDLSKASTGTLYRLAELTGVLQPKLLRKKELVRILQGRIVFA